MNKPLPKPASTPPLTSPVRQKIAFGKLGDAKGQKVLIYGTGGIGKSSLACLAPDATAYVDAENRLSSLKTELVTLGLEMPAIVPCSSWQSLRTALQSDGWDGIKNIVIDSATVIEEWCIKDLLATVKTFEKPPQKATSLEDYGFGKDVRLVYEHFLPLLGDLDRHSQQGRNIILTAHDCKPEESNPMGGNYIRFEPRLRTSKKGENSIRLKVKEWCDFVCFICYDMVNEKDGRGGVSKKAVGGGSRTMYLQETPAYMAKNHGHPDSISLEYGVSPWEGILK